MMLHSVFDFRAFKRMPKSAMEAAKATHEEWLGMGKSNYVQTHKTFGNSGENSKSEALTGFTKTPATKCSYPKK